MDGYRTCTKCGRTLPETEEYFYFKKSRNRFEATCKSCFSAQNKTYREKHKERKKELDHLWYEKNKDHVKEYRSMNKWRKKEQDKRYYEKNKVRIKEYRERNKTHYSFLSKAYYEKNKERAKEYFSQNKEHYRELGRMCTQRRRSRVRKTISSFTLNDWSVAMDYFDNRCAYCGMESKMTQDHFVPVSKGGGYTRTNIIPACKRCNCSKHTADFSDWYPSQPFYSKEREEHILQYLGKAVAV